MTWMTWMTVGGDFDLGELEREDGKWDKNFER